MIVYKIYNENSALWMKEGGDWVEKEELGKVWKKKNHATSALTNAFPKPDLYLKKANPGQYALQAAQRVAKNKGIKIVTYKLSEVGRIDYV